MVTTLLNRVCPLGNYVGCCVVRGKGRSVFYSEGEVSR